MRNYKKILLVLSDGVNDSSAIERAYQMHAITKASVTVVKTVDDLNKLVVSTRPLLPDNVILKKLMIDDMMKTVKSVIKRRRFKLTAYKLLEGSAFLTIIREVLRGKYDLVMISAGGQAVFDKSLFGSTNYHLLRKCPCPVWVVKPRKEQPLKNIMVAVDIDADDKVKTKLNDKLMSAAMTLADEFDAKLHIFNAWRLYGEDTLKHSPFLKVKKNELQKVLREERQLHADNYNDFVAGHDLDHLNVKKLLRKGVASELMPNIVKREKIDLVVMGTVCRVGVAGFFIGNTAEEVLGRLRCSVLTVKPDGFVSPVKI